MKARYLTFFSYIGTGFRSSEKLWIKDKFNVDPESVQGVLELAFLKLKSLNYPRVFLSSRTDGGVHALNCSANVDLERFGTAVYDSEHIVHTVNKFFLRNNFSVSINKCLRVSDNFSARYNALSRKYLYRFAVLKKDVNLPENFNINTVIPIEEWKRCYFVNTSNFDIEKFKEGARYFPGYHDFATFKKVSKIKTYKHSRRLLYSLDIAPGRPLVTSYTSNKRDDLFEYWDVYFHGRGFVHNQIRRIMGTLISVAIGKLPPEEIKVMLQVPSKHSWKSYTESFPPYGLYLCNVEYDPKDLIYNPEEENQIVTDDPTELEG